ncbi:MAG: PorT family protein [Gemmatimonadota bacterium]|nr:MAG: PorT family protein [Gemmatimonadota bacterium]
MNRAMFAAAVVLCLGFAGISDAQAQGFTLGAQGGYNYAQLSDVPTDLDDVGDKGSFVVGAFLDIQFHETLFLGVEGNYVEYKNELTAGTETGDIKQAYIQVPAVLGARLLTGMIQPVVYGGVTANFETTCEIDPGTGTTEDCSVDTVDTKNVTWNAVFGGGVNISLAMIVLNADLRYNLGLSKAAEDEDTKWNSWMALVGIGFKLGN